ncbi:MAG: FAD-dependent oxidoreductase [Desulfuromonadales bacterium C00003096]|nr:MAG: FAD-dependent oxidoreductase [Desulfuromonadales bacterium C00003096]
MTSDFLVIGGGVIGISVARELRKRFSDSRVTLIEKEQRCAEHASGRNSGVLHAGFYYSADSLKAKFTREGNRLLREYCEYKKIPVNKCGKLVVTKDASELLSLDELLKRGRNNGVVLEEITAEEAQNIEPRVLTYERAIFSPTTCSVDPLVVVKSLEQDARAEGVNIHYGEKYVKKKDHAVITTSGTYHAGYLVNAAGLYADRIARDHDFSENYRILPFKGLYLYSDEPPGAIRTNIYPVPYLKNPFLGVHFTVTANGHVKIGPTAIPAFWREHYQGLSNFSFSEFLDVVMRELNLIAFSDFDFKKLAWEEIRKYSRSRMVSLAGSLAKEIKGQNFRRWAKPGMRAQLVDIRKRKLEMDFVLEGDDQSMHILNAVSPGFTCCMPFSRYVCEEITKKLN